MSETREALEAAMKQLSVSDKYARDNAKDDLPTVWHIQNSHVRGQVRRALATLSDERGEERERCAKIADSFGAYGIAFHIRAGGDNGH